MMLVVFLSKKMVWFPFVVFEKGIDAIKMILTEYFTMLVIEKPVILVVTVGDSCGFGPVFRCACRRVQFQAWWVVEITHGAQAQAKAMQTRSQHGRFNSTALRYRDKS